ncbi:MAG TPA: Imm1 family immunity protein [Micromonospora sp.]
MKVTWAYDRGDHRDRYESDVADPVSLEGLLREIPQAGEPVVVSTWEETGDPDELPPGLQIGLGHPEYAFAVHITEDGDYLTDPAVQPPSGGISFDLGGVPTEYPTDYLRLRPAAAIQVAATFLKPGGEPPRAPVVDRQLRTDRLGPDGEGSQSARDQARYGRADHQEMA